MEKTYKEIVKEFNPHDSKKLKHKLAQFTFVVEDDNESYEVVFAVDYDYAIKFFELKNDGDFEMFAVSYTSEDSQSLFDSAIFEGEIQFCYIW